MLARLRRPHDKDGSGFSLIELLLVMLIIGVLAAIATPAFLSQKSKAKESASRSDASNVAIEAAAFLVDGDLTSLTISGSNPNYVLTPVYVDASLNPASAARVKGTAKNILTLTFLPGSDTYCVTATPTDADASPWSVGNYGIKKGTACP